MFRLLPLVVVIASGWGVAGSAGLAAEPQIRLLTPRGLQLEAETEVTLVGVGLDGEVRLLAPFPVASQQVVSLEGDRCRLRIRLDAGPAPGMYPVRIMNSEGVSPPVLLAVDHLPQLTTEQLTEGRLPGLPVAVTGQLTGAATASWTFSGAAGQQLVVAVEAQRLGGKLNPVMRLLDAEGGQLAYGEPTGSWQGDARLQAVLPRDGEYSIQLHDRLYRGAAPGDYRVTAGDLLAADRTLPTGIQRGEQADVRYFGTREGSVLAKVPAEWVPPWFTPAIPGHVGPAPALKVSDHVEVLEERDGDQSQVLGQVPVAVSGVLEGRGSGDVYRLAPPPAGKWRFELFADRLGVPLDGVLILRDSAGKELARGDDQAGTSDPMLEYASPQGGEFLEVEVQSLTGRGGPDFVYRLEITPADQPEVTFDLEADRFSVAAGSHQTIPLRIRRAGFRGPMTVRLVDAPPGLEVSGGEIQQNSVQGLLGLRAGPEAPQAWVVRFLAEGRDGDRAIRRLASFSSEDLPAGDATTQFALARVRPAPISLEFGELGEQDQLYLGAKWPVPLRLERTAAGQGTVRISLLTSQVIPKKKIKENDKDVVVDDLERALRLEGVTEFSGEEVPEVAVLVPADLADQPYDLAFRAELLAADKTTVLANVTTPILRRRPAPPMELTLSPLPGAARAVAGLGGEPTVLRGVVRRAPGFSLPIKVSLAGLPEGVASPEAVLGEEATEFELPLRVAYGAAAGPATVTVVAEAEAGAAEAVRKLQVRGGEIGLEIVPGEKPPATPPLAVFEDDPAFAEQLSKGSGTVSVLTTGAYRGDACLKVTPDQRYHEALPGLGVKITQHPGEGEYRYLRFAWKKQGGATICLQLNHDGAWGPGGGGKPGAKFRYHAGGEQECFGASVRLAETLPQEYVVVTRDLYADFGEFQLTGLALAPVDGEFALFDHIYLARSPQDWALLQEAGSAEAQ